MTLWGYINSWKYHLNLWGDRMAEVKFVDHTEEVAAALMGIAHRAVEECCGELESQVKRNTAVDTGQTKNAWTHNVNSSTEAEIRGTVGNPMENSIWEEMGTGEYALNGDGRKGGWSYRDEEGDWHHTHGKQARRPFFRAYSALKNPMIKHIQDAVKGGLS